MPPRSASCSGDPRPTSTSRPTAANSTPTSPTRGGAGPSRPASAWRRPRAMPVPYTTVRTPHSACTPSSSRFLTHPAEARNGKSSTGSSPRWRPHPPGTSTPATAWRATTALLKTCAGRSAASLPAARTARRTRRRWSNWRPRRTGSGRMNAGRAIASGHAPRPNPRAAPALHHPRGVRRAAQRAACRSSSRAPTEEPFVLDNLSSSTSATTPAPIGRNDSVCRYVVGAESGTSSRSVGEKSSPLQSSGSPSRRASA